MDGFDISIDYLKTIRQANKLKKIAEKCHDVSQDAIREAAYIDQNWKGRAGHALFDKLRKFEKKNEQIVEDLERVSRTMKRIAEDLRESDLQTSERIERTIGGLK